MDRYCAFLGSYRSFRLVSPAVMIGYGETLGVVEGSPG